MERGTRNMRIETTIYTSPITPKLEPLVIAPSQEPVLFSSPIAKRSEELEHYLYLIGEEDRFYDVLPELRKPQIEHYQRTGYSQEQKRWIKVIRDEKQDLSPYPHKTDSEPRELHHIFAQGFLQAYLGLANFPELINHPHNGITLSKIAHRGPYIPAVNESRHPDVHSALGNLRFNPQALKAVIDDHWKMARDGVKYWVTNSDEDMIKIATERTNKQREAQERRKAK
jgi:hypothetical protein